MVLVVIQEADHDSGETRVCAERLFGSSSIEIDQVRDNLAESRFDARSDLIHVSQEPWLAPKRLIHSDYASAAC
jgi:hypothetical protein